MPLAEQASPWKLYLSSRCIYMLSGLHSLLVAIASGTGKLISMYVSTICFPPFHLPIQRMVLQDSPRLRVWVTGTLCNACVPISPTANRLKSVPSKSPTNCFHTCSDGTFFTKEELSFLQLLLNLLYSI